jgi:preprotein translocase subunit YajC
MGSGMGMLLPFLAIGLLFYWLLLRPQQKDRARRDAMLKAIKKNDRVVTIGGIFGVVTNVRSEANEVTIKVDESTNTKLRMTLSSIAQVLADEASEESPKQ